MRERSTLRRSRRIEAGTSGPTPDPLPSWRLPSGLELAEFALQGGFLMPALMGTSAPGERPEQMDEPSLAGVKR